MHCLGQGCSSCRAFFRRSVQNKAFIDFVCRSQQKHSKFCDINSKSWKSCKYCRFQKCQKSGMRTELVLNGIERKIRQDKRTINKHYNNKIVSNGTKVGFVLGWIQHYQ